MAKFAEASRELLEQALASNELRYFTASGGEAMGKTGPEDTAEFAELLVALQECAQLLGETLEMGAVSSAICVKGDETAGFCCDPNLHLLKPFTFKGSGRNQRVVQGVLRVVEGLFWKCNAF